MSSSESLLIPELVPGPAQAMSRRALLRQAALGGLVAALPFPALAADEYDWPSLASMVGNYVAQRRVPDMVALMGQGAAAPLAIAEGRDMFGSARRSDADSLYRIYSMTKPITGMAAMMLVDEGKLALDQPLAEILPKFAEMQVQKVYDGPITPDNLEPARRPITIRQLLTHTSGLGYGIIQSGPIKQAMEARGAVTGLVSHIKLPQLWRGDPAPSLAAYADAVASLPLVYQPGTHWSYSMGLDVMGRVIEVVSGQPFDAFLKARLFGPCGMDSTYFEVPASELYRLTANYAVLNGTIFPIDVPADSVFAAPPPFPMGGSGLVCSPRDYDRFLAMLAGLGELGGKRVMSAAAVQLGTSDLLPDRAVTSGTSVAGYGFGAGGRIGWAGGKRAYGWAGAAGTVGFVDMASGLRGGLFAQYMPVSAYPVYEDFETAVAADLALQKGSA